MAKKIQETGPKALRGVRNSDLYPGAAQANAAFSPEDVEQIRQLSAYAKNNLYRVNAGDVGGDAWLDPSVYEAQNYSPENPMFEYGSSKYDTGILLNPTAGDVQDVRANEQSGLAQLAIGTAKMAGLAGSTFVSGTAGLLAGVGTAIAEGRWSGLFDNAVVNAMTSFNQWMEDVAPAYRTQAQENGPWYNNWDTMNFWADGFIKNLGFTIGSLAAGNAISGILGAAGLGVGAVVAASIGGAVGEALIEANNNYHDIQKLETQKIADATRTYIDNIMNNAALTDEEKDAYIQEAYKRQDQLIAEADERALDAGTATMVANTLFLSLDNFLVWGKMFARGAKNATTVATENVQKEAAKKAAKKAAAEEAVEQGTEKVEKSAAKKAVEEEAEGSSVIQGRKKSKYEKIQEEMDTEEWSDRVAKAEGKYKWKDKTKASAWAAALKNGVLEGHEEIAQGFISEVAGSDLAVPDDPDAYYKAMTDPKARMETQDFMTAMAEGFTNTYLNPDKYSEFAVGFLTGFLGSPTFGRVQNSNAYTAIGRGKPVAWSGGIFGELAATSRMNREGNAAVDVMNKYMDKINANSRYFIQSSAFTDAMNGYAEDKDEFEWRNARDNDDFAAITAFAKVGRLDDLKQMVDQDFADISDEDLDQIAKMTQQDEEGATPGTGWRNQDGTYMSETEEGRQKMREALEKKKTKILEEIAEYEDSVEITRQICANALPEDDDIINEMAWLHWKGKQFDKRYAQIKEKINPYFQGFVDTLQQIQTALKEEGEAEDSKTYNIYTDRASEVEASIKETKNEKERLKKEIKKVSRRKKNNDTTSLNQDLQETEQKLEDLNNELAELRAAETEEADRISRGEKSTFLTENEEQQESTQGLLEFLQLMQKKVGVMGLYSYLKQNPGMLTYLTSKSFYDMYQKEGGELKADEWQELLTSLVDISRMSKAAVQFNERYDEYRRDPFALLRNRQKIDSQREDQENVKKEFDKVDYFRSKKDSEIFDDVLAGTVNLDDFDFSDLDSIADEEAESDTSTEDTDSDDAAPDIEFSKEDLRPTDSPEDILGGDTTPSIGTAPSIDTASKKQNTLQERLEALKAMVKKAKSLADAVPGGLPSETLRDAHNLIFASAKAALDAQNHDKFMDFDDDLFTDIEQFSSLIEDERANQTTKLGAMVAKGVDEETIQEYLIQRRDAAVDALRQAVDSKAIADAEKENFSATTTDGEEDSSADDTQFEAGGGPDPVNTPEPINSGKKKEEKKKKAEEQKKNIESVREVYDLLQKAIHIGNEGQVKNQKNVVKAFLQNAAVTANSMSSPTWKSILEAMRRNLGQQVDIALATLDANGVSNEVLAEIMTDVLDNKFDASKYAERLNIELDKKDDGKETSEEAKDDTRILTPIITESDLSGEENDLSEEETPENPKDPEDNTTKQESSQLDYWKPTSRRLPYAKTLGSNTPYWKSLPEGPLRTRLKAIDDYHRKHGTYTRVEQGIATKPGTVVQFLVDPKLNEAAGEIVILLANAKGEIIGELMSKNDSVASRQTHLLPFIKRVEQEFAKHTGTGVFNFSEATGITSKVRQQLIGRVPYTDRNTTEDLTLNDLAKESGAGSFVLAIKTSTGLQRKPGDKTASKLILEPKSGKPGQPYVLFSSCKGYIAVPFITPRFNADIKESQVAQIVRRALKILLAGNATIDNGRGGRIWGKGPGSEGNAASVLKNLLAVEAINSSYKGGRLNNTQCSTITIKINGNTEYLLGNYTKVSKDASLDDVVEVMMQKLYSLNIPVQISLGKINTNESMENCLSLDREDFDYNALIGEIAHVNIMPEVAIAEDGAANRSIPFHTVNDWFTINPIVINAKTGEATPISAERVPQASTSERPSSEEISYEVDGIKYVRTKDWSKIQMYVNGRKKDVKENLIRVVRNYMIVYDHIVSQGGDPMQPAVVRLNNELYLVNLSKVNLRTGNEAGAYKKLSQQSLDNLGAISYNRGSTQGEVPVDAVRKAFNQIQNDVMNAKSLECTFDDDNVYFKLGGKTILTVNYKVAGIPALSALKERLGGKLEIGNLHAVQNEETGSSSYTGSNLATVLNTLKRKIFADTPSLDMVVQVFAEGDSNIQMLAGTQEKKPEQPKEEKKKGTKPSTQPADTNSPFTIKNGFDADTIAEGIIERMQQGKTWNSIAAYLRKTMENIQSEFRAQLKEAFANNDAQAIRDLLGAVIKPEKQSDETPSSRDTDQDQQGETKPTIQQKRDALLAADPTNIYNNLWTRRILVMPEKYLDAAMAAIDRGIGRQYVIDTVINNSIVKNGALVVLNEDALMFNEYENEDVPFRASEIPSFQDEQQAAEDIEKERKWLAQALPQFSSEERTVLVDSIARISNDPKAAKAHGAFKNAIIYLNKRAAAGTLYHESFHAVIRALMTDAEREILFQEARKVFGDLSRYNLEEKLAEEFRKYMERNRKPVSGFLARFFEWLKHFVQNLLGKEPYIDKLFYDISRGKFRNRTIQNVTGEVLRDDFTEEMRNIIANAPRDSQGRLLAPNGKPSNLTERQYAQVRTKAFKDWFGDWETLAEQDVLMPIGTSGSGKSTWIKSLPNSSQYVIISPDEMRVEFTGDMNNKTKDDEIYQEAANRAVAAIRQGKKVIFDTTNLKKARRTVFTDAIYAAMPNAKIGYQIMPLNAAEAKRRIANDIARGVNRANVSPETIDRHAASYPQMLEDIKSEKPVVINTSNISKVVDENGEPLVVYHGSPNNFNVFDETKIGTTSDYGVFGKGFYFTPLRSYATKYGNNVNAYFLNLRNPYRGIYAGGVLNDSNYKPHNPEDSYTRAYQRALKLGKSEEEAKRAGEHARQSAININTQSEKLLSANYDGVDATGKQVNSDEKQYVAFTPNQIKSATDNVGTFDSSNADIRYRMPDIDQEFAEVEINKRLMRSFGLLDSETRKALEQKGFTNKDWEEMSEIERDFALGCL